MKLSNEPVQSSKLIISDTLSSEYIKEAEVLAEKYASEVKKHEKNHDEIKGRDDSGAFEINKITKKFRDDVQKLRQKYNL